MCGESFNYIPTLNECPEHIELLSKIICQHAQGWPEFSPEWNSEEIEQGLVKTRTLADKHKYNK